MSQPKLIAMKLKHLDVLLGARVLEIGTASAYQTALLSYLVGDEGAVISLEFNKALYNHAKTVSYPFHNVSLFHLDGSKGFPDMSPFNKIIVGAAAPKIPQEFLDQLDIEGIVVMPVGIQLQPQKIVSVKKMATEEGRLYWEEKTVIPNVDFVPLKEMQ